MTHDVAIVGAGYVGLPLARTFADAGKKVVLVDVDPERVAQLNQGDATSRTSLRGPGAARRGGPVVATTDYDGSATPTRS